MCEHMHYIRNKYTHERVLVACGHCPACRQQKADRLASRINFDAKQSLHDGLIQVFITLDYSPHSVPYVLANDIANISKLSDFKPFYGLPLYRDSHYSRSYGTVSLLHEPTEVTTLEVPAIGYHLTFDEVNKYHLNQKNGYGKIGIIYYKDLQNFEKRVASVLARSGKGYKVRWFNASEYGPSTWRPHFHVVATIPKDRFRDFRDVVMRCWPFSDWKRPDRSIQVARKVASYVASYVNCSTDLPQFLNNISKPKHSFSKFYGFNGQRFSYDKVSEMVRRGDLHLPIMFDKFCGEDSLRLLPAHVLLRYYPKFKGISRLDPSEIFSIIRRPESIRDYAARLEYTEDDVKNTVSVLKRGAVRCGKRYPQNAVSYFLEWSKAWSTWKLNILSDWYRDQENGADVYQSYDNLQDLRYNSRFRSYGIDKYKVISPNEQPHRVELSRYYANKFQKKKKERKVNGFLYGY